MTIETIDLRGKRVLVTGGTTGIGRATVALLAAHGAHVLTFGRNEPELADSLENARRQGGQVDGLTADVATQEGVAKIFAAVAEKLEGLDILINNAGISIKPVQEMSDAEWRYGVETDFVGYLACARGAITHLKRRVAISFSSVRSALIKSHPAPAHMRRQRRAFRPMLKRFARNWPISASR